MSLHTDAAPAVPQILRTGPTDSQRRALLAAPFGVYVHVPFCAARCGYCDFNTYTPGELGGAASPESYLEALCQELEQAARTCAQWGMLRPADTVFVGGGTPSLLGADGLGKLLSAVRDSFGLAPGAEVTTESNPESTSPEFFARLRDYGFTRVSLGLQSVAPHVLAVLERRHTPGRALAAAREALAAGFKHVNLDMIYGTPGERDADVAATVEAILETGVDHVSAYSLIVEDGTRMARKVRTGQLPAPDEDVLARRFELIDAALAAAGMDWYEVSNWARPGGACRHNEIYWVDGNWWGAGPGAHSHLGDERFFNVKHPATYARAVAAGQWPIKDSEVLSAADRHTEAVMLGLRLKEGIPESWIRGGGREVVGRYVARGLLHRGVDKRGTPRVAVTDAGRLLADGIITDILVAEE
ncbi:radical SAM family heme chaperone HemW [Corynebacterium uberis]|uniref:radical SAM family heme chaperone HemW n=1 Tax=Corynebacterium TaxID=1716 RepID=UPI001D0BE495|nr:MULTISPECIES: radical SAM family heme chaperone HemW [Corynebacterium]MCZ9308200.1 radical SAM family heme chaperone HemW [Corynebacterium sp. c6VSa_13]UDL73881.1 radical SAM family heme chaperone HemW [Corynebacterium uberis]UDL75236.1 radical SAM family heme chaperone HemW [Corynebacterium uberis]UDL77447.1 radical SAM family heme chaperone HemW [Corynebacterium uberis]UDL79733.1 radical SAM family heme chaperone HemW [Corynebacterium uberis]